MDGKKLIITGIFLFGATALIGKSNKIVSLLAEDSPLDDPNQESYIQNLHLQARAYFRKFIREVESRTGWKVLITSGYRTFAKQQQLKQENSNNAKPGDSWHNYGMAIDINLTKGNTTIKKANSKQDWNNTGVPQIAELLGFDWGGNFTSYHDPVHFDIRDIIENKFSLSIGDLKNKAFNQFGTDWDNIEGNKVTF
jgi:hypothetical protein